MKNNHNLSANIRIIGIVFTLALATGALVLVRASAQLVKTTPTPSVAVPPPTICADPFFYGFDTPNIDMGWKAQTTVENSLAISRVKQSSEIKKSGLGALELNVDLDGKKPNKRSGETFINLVSTPPIGFKAPFDLEGVPITIWFFAPAKTAGNPQVPNGVQIFVKDQQNRSEYSRWGNLTNNTERWVSLTLVPTKNPSESDIKAGFKMQDGFDPSIINVIGFKIGIGQDPNGEYSTVNYSGSIWIDDICWQKL